METSEVKQIIFHIVGRNTVYVFDAQGKLQSEMLLAELNG
jgi:hypothetical protein